MARRSRRGYPVGMRHWLLAVLLTAPGSALAWEARADRVAERLREPPGLLQARQSRRPGWSRRVTSPNQRVSWSEDFDGKTYVFGVGMARGIASSGLDQAIAGDRAREGIADVAGPSLQGSTIVDWYLAPNGDLYALAVLIR